MSIGPVMLDLQGLALQQEEKEILAHPSVGGVILFARNYDSPDQLQELVRDIQASRDTSPLIAVDQEGGRVQRFKDGFSRLPPLTVFGQCYQKNPDQARRAAQDVGWLMASELRAWGVDFSFAPVLDLDIGVSEVIGDRAFSDDPKVIAALGYAWRHGGHEAGMASVGKHFPGHGAVAADSHVDLPIDHRTFDEIWAQDVLPFKHLINNGLEAIMPAHVIYEACDAQPAGFSQFWIKQVLRERLGFNGVVFSDDLSMKAADVVGGYADRAHIALEAGCDMVLVCNCPEGAIETIESLESYQDPVAQTRLVRMHGKGQYTIDEIRENPRWHNTLDLIENLMGDHELSMEF